MDRRLPIRLVCAAWLLAGTAQATSLSIPWNLNFNFKPSDTTSAVSSFPGTSTINLANFSTNYQATTHIEAKIKPLFVTLASVDVTAGLGFPASAQDEYHLSLPFNVTFTAPDHARPGQNVFVQSSIGFSGTPVLTAAGKLDYATDAILHGSASLGPFGGDFNLDHRLPSSFSANGSGLILGGSGTYSAKDTSAESVSVGPFARSTLGDGIPVANSTTKFEGKQFVTEGSVDAQRGSLNLLSVLRAVPAIGAAAAALDAVSDLDFQAGVELQERSIFTTGAIYALYSENGGKGNRRATVLNGLGQQGFNVAVPTDATGNYAIDLYGLGLGLGLQRQLLLQPELALIFDPILFGKWTIFEKEFADALLTGTQTSRFQYEEIFSDPRSSRFIPQSQRLLSFALDAAAPPPLPPTNPDLPAGLSDEGTIAGGSVTLPGTAPTQIGSIYVEDVPEPATWGMMIIGLGFVGSIMRLRPAGSRFARARQYAS